MIMISIIKQLNNHEMIDIIQESKISKVYREKMLLE
jgi:hypothetical protein